MRTIRKILVHLVFLHCAGYTTAALADTLSPVISFKHFGEENGLVCKTIYEAIQDNDGFLWFATDAGAFRFDGKIFKRFTIEDGLTDNEVLKIHQDHYGRVWFLTLNGHLSFWKKGKIYNPGNTLFLKKAYTSGSIQSCFEDKRKRLWLGTSKFGFIVIAGDSTWKVKSPTDEKWGVVHIHQDSTGNLWAFNREKMFRFTENDPRDTIMLPYGITDFLSCHDRKSSDMYYFSDGGIYRISGQVITLYAGKQAISPDNVINIVSDNDYLWICTRGNGCYELVKGIYRRKYLENFAITSAFRDRENNVWFNTMGKGVYMFASNADSVINYNQQSGLSNDNIISIVSGTNNDVWLGYNNGTVEQIAGNRRITFKLNGPDDPKFNRVTCMAADFNTILCGTDMGAYSILNDKVKFILSKGNFDNGTDHYAFKRLLIDKKKNIYAAHSNGLFKIAENSGSYYLENEIFSSPARTFAITEYSDNHLLISTTNGLMEYAQGLGYTRFETDSDFSSIRILDVKTVPEKFLVLATNGKGIYVLKDKKVHQHLSTATGLSDNNCKRIFIEGDVIYVSTDNGLDILTKANDDWSVSEIITTKNGLLSNTINDAIVNNGKIYLATEKGLSIMNQSIVTATKFKGKVYVTEIITDSVHETIDTEYNFKADIPRLLIHFAYPVFSPANDLKVKYRLLEGKTDNSEWVSSENNEIEFSSLNPGQYIFQLKPDAQSVSAAGITNLYINIIPLWWQTNAARIVLVLLVIGLIIMIVRRRIQAQYKKQVAELRQLTMLETERSRIASDMHDDIGADLTQISIWSNILKSAENKNKDVVSRITKSSNEVLQKMEQIIWALNSSHNQTSDLISYLREYALQYLESAGINLLFEVSGVMPELEVSAIQKRNVFLTIKELLHNTVKHSGAQNVSVKLYVSESILNIEYTDDGKGFTPKEKEDGMGNITVQKRMKEINSSISMQSSPGSGFNAQLKIKLTDRDAGTGITP